MAEDIELRDQHERAAVLQLAARFEELHRQADERWETTQRLIAILHTANSQIQTKGDNP
jgi:hypothetical protein